MYRSIRHPQLATLVRAGALFLSFFWSSHLQANYAKAQAYFARKNYPDAATYFFQAYSYPKDSAEKIKAEWGLGQSLQRLGFYFSASKYYSIIVRRGHRANNPFFRNALEELGRINSTISLGQSHIVQLFRTKIEPSSVPGPARGFYFHYLGIEAFNRKQYDEANSFFRRVPVGSDYYAKSIFYQGVIATLLNQRSRSISYFERVGQIAARQGDRWLWEQAHLNIARVHYEAKRYRDALRHYAEIPRSSENWLQALFEASWGFFLMHKHNNVLGNIHTLHSPFFDRRFFPESHILQSITFLRLCRVNRSRDALAQFKARYEGTYKDLKGLLRRYAGDPKGFYKIVYDYRIGSLNRYRSAWAILDALSRNDAYREAGKTIRFADRELSRLGRLSSRWASVGLADELGDFLSRKKSAAISDAGRRLFQQGKSFLSYLKDLSDQTHLINAEIQLKKIDLLRAKLNVGTADKKGDFIGGLQPLNVSQDLEYWPFEEEYWEDELGGYVYNIESLCGKKK